MLQCVSARRNPIIIVSDTGRVVWSGSLGKCSNLEVNFASGSTKSINLGLSR